MAALGVRDYPGAILEVFGGTLLAALAIGFVYGRSRDKRAWCRHACPIGLLLGTGVSLGGFLWLVLPEYLWLRQTISVWAIDHGGYWIGQLGAIGAPRQRFLALGYQFSPCRHDFAASGVGGRASALSCLWWPMTGRATARTSSLMVARQILPDLSDHAPPFHGFYRHPDKETEVAAWWPPFEVSWDFTYTGIGKKGGY